MTEERIIIVVTVNTGEKRERARAAKAFTDQSGKLDRS